MMQFFLKRTQTFQLWSPANLGISKSTGKNPRDWYLEPGDVVLGTKITDSTTKIDHKHNHKRHEQVNTNKCMR